ncbi:FAD-dependent oxidoreductase [Salinibacterium sp. ZJ454]|uniref:dihydrolipoyl dehydrogenase family protein n=1 Tax=Salinibacterium sp. ZJ454 TaxID=2708339 RepID=UPI001AB02E1C|nr:FAD-dependent oxidoreductase [Salinibacterium sp. ZJ454]
MEPEEFDLLVVGGGKAGKTLAMDRAKAGQNVAMIERAMIGGSCINVACIPTKSFVTSARVLALVQRAGEYGITGVGDAVMDGALLHSHKDSVVAAMVASNHKQFIASGMDFILGEAQFVGPRTVHVLQHGGGARTLRGAEVVVDVGTEPLLPAIDGVTADSVQTSDTMLTLEAIPPRFIVVGGGYVGVEYAAVLQAIGSQVTLLDGGSQLLGREDPDVADAVLSALTSLGVEVRLGVELSAVSRATGAARAPEPGTSTSPVTARLSDGSQLSADDLLMAVGRRPVTAGLGLELAGVKMDARGYIEVDDELRTSAPHVWAAGDVAGTPQFTHASLDDYRVLKDNLAGAHRSTRDRVIPYVVFMTPELARVGLTEREAREAGHDVRIARMPASVVPRNRTAGQLEGTWKAVVDRSSGLILGAALLGSETSEVITTVQLAMQAELPHTALRDMIITHPTVTEGLNLLFSGEYLEE